MVCSSKVTVPCADAVLCSIVSDNWMDFERMFVRGCFAATTGQAVARGVRSEAETRAEIGVYIFLMERVIGRLMLRVLTFLGCYCC